MTADEFRALAMSLPEAEERSHMGHPDFRVRGKIFATLSPTAEWGMVKLPPQEQKSFVWAEPEVFQPFGGAWGRHGCTKVMLASADELTVRQALTAAWKNTAPKKLAQQYDDE